MPVTHPFVNPQPDGADATVTRPSDWNAEHTVSIDNADVANAAAIVESKLSLNFATHAAVTVADTTSIDMSISGQQISAAAIFGTTSTTIAQGDHTHAQFHDAVTLDANADTLLSLSTQALGLDTQLANKVFAGATSGGAAVPAFRSLVAADIPVSFTLVDGTRPFTGTVGGVTPVATTDLATKAYVDLAVASLHLTEYLSASALSPVVGTFLKMDNAAVGAGTVQSVDITGTIGAPTAIFKWMTPVGFPHLDRIPAGAFDIHAHLLKTTTAPNNKVVAIYAEIWQNTAAGAHTALIATSSTYQGFTTLNTFYDIYATVATEFPLAVTDRLSIEFFGYVISGSGQNKLTMTVGGTSDSHMDIDVASTELSSIFVTYTGAESNLDMGAKNITAAEYISTLSGTVNRDGNGLITSVAKTGGRTLTLTRDGNDMVSSITDGTRTWTLTRNGSNQITSWSVA